MSKNYPFVSICTPTFNRRPFIEMMFSCFKNQTYPKDKMEWIIVDDGTDKIEDLIGRKVSFYLASKFLADRDHIILFKATEK